MTNKIPAFLLEKPSPESLTLSEGVLKIPFIEKGIHHLADLIKTGYIQWETALKDDFLQKVDARVKVLFLLFYVVIVSLKKDIAIQAIIGIFVFVLALTSRLNIIALYKRVVFWGFIFGFLIALPSAFNVITPGEIILPLLELSRNHSLWIYQIPKEIGITKQGIDGVLMLTSRVMNSLALSLLVSYTTPFTEIFKAMVGRGFSDNIRLHGFRKLNLRDWSTGIALCLIGAVLLWI